MGDGVAYFMWLIASAAVGLFCLIGIVVSIVALRTHASPQARTGLRLSWGSPLAVVASFAISMVARVLLERIWGI
jgi:hypothetical protein